MVERGNGVNGIHQSNEKRLQKLNAPQRQRSITVDESIKEIVDEMKREYTHLHSDVDNNSSDSDDDEVDKVRSEREPVKPNTSSTKITRTNSCLSLESLANDRDELISLPAQNPTNGSPTNQVHKRMKTLTCYQSGSSPSTAQRAEVSGQKVVQIPPNSNHERKSTSHPQSLQKSNLLNNKNNGIKNSTNFTSKSSSAQIDSASKHQYPNPTGSQPFTKLPTPESNPTPNKMDSKVNKPVQVQQDTQNKELIPVTNNDLINVRALGIHDDSGSDRFIFFSYRAQRFHFKANIFLSTLSPFAAVASDMEGVTTRSVCAACGSGGRLAECKRCPLAFHLKCINPLKRSPPPKGSWLCHACTAVSGSDRSGLWTPDTQPAPLPPPDSGFDRLIQDAKDGNPIDFVLNPSLFRYYITTCGEDWLKCFKCSAIWVAEEGVLSEAIRAPFECKHAFWVPSRIRDCGVTRNSQRDIQRKTRVQAHLRSKSQKRNALFFYGFGEEDRLSYGYLPVDETDEDNIQIATKQSNPSVSDTTTSKSLIKSAMNAKELNRIPNQPTVQQVQKTPQIANRGQPVSTKSPSESVIATKTKNIETIVIKQKPVTSAPIITDATMKAVPSRAETAFVPKPMSGVGSAGIETVNKQSNLNQRRVVLPSNTEQPELRLVTPPKPDIQLRRKTDRTEGKNDNNPSPMQIDSPKPEDLQQDIIEFIATIGFDENVEDSLTDLALENDKSLSRLYQAFRNDRDRFMRHATRLAKRASSTGMERTSSANTAPLVQVTPAISQQQVLAQQHILQQQQQQRQRFQALQQQRQLLTHPSVSMQQTFSSSQGVSQNVVAQQAAVRPQPSLQQLELNQQVQHLKMRQMQEFRNLETELMKEMAATPPGLVPQVMKKQAVTTREMQLKHERQTKALVQHYKMSVAQKRG